MLAVSRHLFCHAWFGYDFLMVSGVQSLIAIEVALRHLLQEAPRRRGPGMRSCSYRAGCGLGNLATDRGGGDGKRSDQGSAHRAARRAR